MIPCGKRGDFSDFLSLKDILCKAGWSASLFESKSLVDSRSLDSLPISDSLISDLVSFLDFVSKLRDGPP